MHQRGLCPVLCSSHKLNGRCDECILDPVITEYCIVAFFLGDYVRLIGLVFLSFAIWYAEYKERKSRHFVLGDRKGSGGEMEEYVR